MAFKNNDPGERKPASLSLTRVIFHSWPTTNAVNFKEKNSSLRECKKVNDQ